MPAPTDTVALSQSARKFIPQMMVPVHITVCICTFERQALLERLLRHVLTQSTQGRFSYSVVVVDNDVKESARPTVERAASATSILVTYRVQGRRGIALARNKALEGAVGDYIAFIDDDEMPCERWLLTLLETCERFEASGVVGTTTPQFDGEPPEWVVKGGFYDRASYPTGFEIDWRKGRTGNVLFKSELFAVEHPAFRAEFLSGEDQDFFRRMIERGYRFVWCGDVLAREIIPPVRWKRSFMLRKALLRGSVAVHEPAFGPRDVLRSVAATVGYVVVLPFSSLAGQHVLMKHMVSLFHHLGKVLSVAGIHPIKDAYVTQ